MDYSEKRDMDEILMSIKKATMFMDPFMKVMGMGTIMLMTYFARMVKEGKLSKHEFRNFQEFAKLTKGDYTIQNIPADGKGGVKYLGENAFQKELKELKKLGIRYSMLPDLDVSDTFVQIAVMNEDKEKFRVWMEEYLTKKMSGGVHELRNLQALTNGNTSVISIPLEGCESVFQEDFQTLGVNYAVLPDLRVGDGQIQLMVANSDIQKVEHWYKLYQEDMLKQGEDVPDIGRMDMETYQKTGELSAEEYINTADQNLKVMNQKYEKAPGMVEQTIIAKESMIKSDDSMAYAAMEADLRFQKFTINKETLVEPIRETALGKAELATMEENGYFLSRVPHTFGDSTQYLLVPKEQVFLSSDGKTYTAFLEKTKQPLTFDKAFNVIGMSKRSSAEELFRKHYDLSHQEKKLTQDIHSQMQYKENKIPQHIKAPTVPKKVR